MRQFDGDDEPREQLDGRLPRWHGAILQFSNDRSDARDAASPHGSDARYFISRRMPHAAHNDALSRRAMAVSYYKAHRFADVIFHMFSASHDWFMMRAAMRRDMRAIFLRRLPLSPLASLIMPAHASTIEGRH